MNLAMLRWLLMGTWSCVVAAFLFVPAQVPGATQDLYVSGTFSFPDTSVKRFDGLTGLPVGMDGSFASGGGLSFPRGLTFGPNGNLFVASDGTGSVLEYDRTTGVYVSEFVASGSGGLDLNATKGLVFAPDGKLYVAGSSAALASTDVFRYDAMTGSFIDKLSDFPVGGLAYGTPWGVTVGTDHNVYFTNEGTSNIVRFDPTTSTLSEFVSAVVMGFIPHGLTFGPDGNLYVGIFDVPGRVLKFDGTTGASLGVFVSAGIGGLSRPDGLVFGPDGKLYVSSNDTNSVLRYDGTTGAFLDVFASLSFPLPFGPGGLTFSPVPEPATMALSVVGGTLLLIAVRRR